MNTLERITATQVCAAVQDAQGSWPTVALMPTPAELLHRRTGHPTDACQRAVDRAYDDGLLRVGVSQSRPALTKAGAALLAGGAQ